MACEVFAGLLRADERAAGPGFPDARAYPLSTLSPKKLPLP
jgi:hypothetical protein